MLPARLHVTRDEPWMRATLALWWLALGFGVATYAVRYGLPLTRLALSR